MVPAPVDPQTAPAVQPHRDAPAGLRERKKFRTRMALVTAATALIERQGYDATSVDEIAEAAQVSARTFFRYFAGKEQVLLSVSDELNRIFVRAVAERPSEEAPLEAMGAAMDSVLRELPQHFPADAVPVDFCPRVMRLVHATPALLGAQIRARAASGERLTALLAERQGVDPATDPRPRLTVAVFEAVAGTAAETWLASGSLDLTVLQQSIRDCLRDLPGALSADWASTAPGTEGRPG